MRKTLTDKGVAAIKPRAARYAFPDPELRGHYVRIASSGAKTYVTVARSPDGRQIWSTIGTADTLKIEGARQIAREVIRRVRGGLPAFEAPPAEPDSFEAVAEQWVKRHVEAKRLRTARQITGLLADHVYPFWKGRTFLSIRRSDVAALLDDVEDGHSPRQADRVLVIVRAIMTWYATRNDDYAVPIVKGMRRQNPKEHERSRILDDRELAAVWKAAEADGTVFGAFVRGALLTAQRRAKVATMRWADVSLDGEWTIPAEAREKQSAGSLVLPQMALDIIRAQPRLGNNPYVFAGRGLGAFNGFGKSKARLDSQIPDVAPWTVHDLRRTARSLMSRAGVSSEIAEIVMGHALGGVKGVYDRHSYRNEKAEALRKLAALIGAIVNPRENVVPIRGATRHDNVTGGAG